MSVRNGFFYLAGLLFLALAKGKNILKGYTSPKPFELTESDRCAKYDIQVVEAWLSHLQHYAGDSVSVEGKQVLELGPGSDLGVGITLLSKGCARYNACDVNHLMKAAPVTLYELLVEKLAAQDTSLDIDVLRADWTEALAGRTSRLNYVVNPRFDLVEAFGLNSVDLVFSQAAFEHFDDMDATVEQLTEVCRPGAIVVTEIDLKTHSRWVRDKDPNNIYRYPRWLYRWFGFRGIPSRLRPADYQSIFEQNGWENVQILPLTTLSAGTDPDSGMNKAFVGKVQQMEMLTVLLCARKSSIT